MRARSKHEKERQIKNGKGGNEINMKVLTITSTAKSTSRDNNIEQSVRLMMAK